MRALRQLRLKDEVVRLVGAGDMPFLAIQDIVLPGASRRGPDRADVGSGVALSYGVALVAFATDVRHHPFFHLIVRVGAGFDQPGRRGIVAPSERISDLADLLLDHDLLEKTQSGPTERSWDP